MSEPTEPEQSQSGPFIDEQPSPCDQEYPETELSQEPTMTDSSSESDCSSIKQYHATLATESRTRINKYLRIAGESPITKRKLQSKKYKKSKLRTIVKMMENVGIDDKPKPIADDEIISQLKEKYSTAPRSEKLQILTILPNSWSLGKIESEFRASNFVARKAKQLVKEKGILSTPNPKPGRSLPQTSIEVVIHFYESDENSRMMPGKKDCISVRGAGGRITVQKRLILSNLLYHTFKDKHPEQKIGFSKFAELRSRHCVLAGASGTHAVCVCTIHQNMKLMMQSIKLGKLTTSDGTSLQTYQHCIAQAICNPPLYPVVI